MSVVGRVDRLQRRHTMLGFPIAVIYKFVDDRGPYLAALLTYYGFVSLFPLLLLFVTVLGYVAAGNHGFQQSMVNSALAQFPVVGPQLRHNISGFTGNGTALVVGILGALYGGIGIMQAAQTAFNTIYGIPRNSQPNPIKSRLRSLLLLLVLGGGVLVSTGIAVLVSTSHTFGHEIGGGLQVAARILTVLLDIAIFTAAYQLLVACDLRIRQVLLGGVLSGVAWQVLQTFGASYLSSKLQHSRELYGTFALVLGLLAWIYLQALAVVLCAEINVTLHHRLWPRALLTPFTDQVQLTDADEEAYGSYARAQRFKGFERIAVDFERNRRDRHGRRDRARDAQPTPPAAPDAPDAPSDVSPDGDRASPRTAVHPGERGVRRPR